MKISREPTVGKFYIWAFIIAIIVFAFNLWLQDRKDAELAYREKAMRMAKIAYTPKQVEDYQLAEIILFLQPKLDTMYSLYIAKNIVENCYLNNVCPILVTAIMYRESAFDQMALSEKGAIGLMQINFKAWKGKEEIEKAVKPTKLYQIGLNVKSGIRILQHYLKKKGTVKGALEGYLGEKNDAYYKGIMQTAGEISIKLFSINSKGGGGRNQNKGGD